MPKVLTSGIGPSFHLAPRAGDLSIRTHLNPLAVAGQELTPGSTNRRISGSRLPLTMPSAMADRIPRQRAKGPSSRCSMTLTPKCGPLLGESGWPCTTRRRRDAIRLPGRVPATRERRNAARRASEGSPTKGISVPLHGSLCFPTIQAGAIVAVDVVLRWVPFEQLTVVVTL